jgi:hypothetical protein
VILVYSPWPYAAGDQEIAAPTAERKNFAVPQQNCRLHGVSKLARRFEAFASARRTVARDARNFRASSGSDGNRACGPEPRL